MKPLALLFAFVVATPPAFATAQYPDKLVLEGETHSLHSNPLAAYFSRHRDRLPKSTIDSSALWRGYVSTSIPAGRFVSSRRFP